jgi:hypothetical protein
MTDLDGLEAIILIGQFRSFHLLSLHPKAKAGASSFLDEYPGGTCRTKKWHLCQRKGLLMTIGGVFVDREKRKN